MRRKSLLLPLIAILAIGICGPDTSRAADHGDRTTFVHLEMGVPAVLYQPATPGPRSHIALFVMHPQGDYLDFSACSELSERGFQVLCANYRSDKTGDFDDGNLDDMIEVVGLAVKYLRSQPGIEKVVLFGHSGGATIMSAYQDIAQNGVGVCQDAQKIHKCPDTLAGLPAADGVVMADPNWGQAAMVLFSVDPAVASETSGMKLNPALDMYNPANGFNLSGSNYSEKFIHRFLAAEGRRNDALIARAQRRLAAVDAGKGEYTDDEPLTIPGAFVAANKLFTQDTALISHTQNAWPLLRGNGTVVTQVIHSVRVPEGTTNPSPLYHRGALKTTVRDFLSGYAIRVTRDYGYDADSVHGVEWHSTYAAVPGNMTGITTPFLVLGMTGHWEGMSAETIYEHAKSRDKTIAFVEGAVHTYTPCTKCEKTPGEFGDTVKTTYDYIAGWLSKPGRFLPNYKERVHADENP